ncbi:hypothetical protein LBMAG42_46400 [Deltaproteobacteria bacterium]|nr:hypothetical protein LBMAG42_46400 [Deltaproteobacteria bacterium]
MHDADIAHFLTFGFVVLRRHFDPTELSAELDRAIEDGHPPRAEPARVGARLGGDLLPFRYVPMMNERTPASLALLDHFAPFAAALLGVPVLPVRAKGVEYQGSSQWHRDSDGAWPSIGFAAYLEPLRGPTGALRVIPGSHVGEFAASVARYIGVTPSAASHDGEARVERVPARAIDSDPGDVIAFDERLFHASFQHPGAVAPRRQWRVDFVAAPVQASQEPALAAWFGSLYQPGWDGGYDVDLFPSYGEHWRASGRPWVETLSRLGVYAAAGRQEDFMRSQRSVATAQG